MAAQPAEAPPPHVSTPAPSPGAGALARVAELSLVDDVAAPSEPDVELWRQPQPSPLDVLEERRPVMGVMSGLAGRSSDWSGERGRVGGPRIEVAAPPSRDVLDEFDARRRRAWLARIQDECLSRMPEGQGVFRLALFLDHGWVGEVRTLENSAPEGLASCVEPLAYHASLPGSSRRSILVVRIRAVVGAADD